MPNDAAVDDAFVERYLERVRALPAGDPPARKTVIEPIVNRSQLGTTLDKLRAARDDGAEQLLGGESTGPTGPVLPPHVLLGTNEVAAARQEVFGPVVTVVRAGGGDDDHETAFGGDKASGPGRFGGDWVIDERTTDQWVNVRHERRRYRL